MVAQVEVQTLFIESDSPWENGYIQSFYGKLRVELVNREIFGKIVSARVLIERWRVASNTIQPHSALDDRPPAPEADNPAERRSP